MVTLPDQVAMRMGNGVTQGARNANITFVTTGYIARLLAHHPQAFDDHTHFIIDEVHERSVDSDLLCLLARRLLVSNPKIKLILMSATIHTALYKKYFSDFGHNHGQEWGSMECLSVGVRRFPLDIKYLDDMVVSTVLRPDTRQGCENLKRQCDRLQSVGGSDGSIDERLVTSQWNMAVDLTQTLGKMGTGVLIFVSGINDITELMERFEGIQKFLTIGIHR
tara:strand:- start:59 stop:724 length:666 start_codon:yes stop_codon:yes gene_type:complete